ncbi:MAG: RAD55 family ATPase [Halobacteriaceae archaeon]
MDRIPFGVSQLDELVGGGAPAGSVVLLAGEAGAGAREFGFTSAMLGGLAETDPDAFRLHYGDLAEAAALPPEIHYVSMTAATADLRAEMSLAFEDDLVEAGLGGVTFCDLSAEYFQLSPVPREWYAGSRGTISELADGEQRRDVIESLADYFDEHAEGSLLVVDSLTDLVSVAGGRLHEWRDVVYLLKGLRKASRRWGGLVLIHVAREAIPDQRMGDLMTSVDGTMLFEWTGEGSERKRSLVVKEFRGVLSQLEDEDIVRFETEIREGGFDITNVRKLR